MPPDFSYFQSPTVGEIKKTGLMERLKSFEIPKKLILNEEFTDYCNLEEEEKGNLCKV
jgi:hypothetical protein